MLQLKCPHCGGKLVVGGETDVVVTKHGTRIVRPLVCDSCGQTVEENTILPASPEVEINIGGSVASLKVAPEGDLVEGDVINVGPIIGSTGVVIGGKPAMVRVKCPFCGKAFPVLEADLSLGYKATGEGVWERDSFPRPRLVSCPHCGGVFTEGEEIKLA